MEKLALAEAEKASAEARKHAAVEAENKALLDKLTEPSGVSDEEALKRVATIIERAVANGLTEVQVYRFPTRFAPITAAPSISRSPVGKRPSPACPRRFTSSGTDSSVLADTSSGSRYHFPAGGRVMSA